LEPASAVLDALANDTTPDASALSTERRTLLEEIEVSLADACPAGGAEIRLTQR
jgi:hypothetical protein